jgi:hypothetical protein
MSYRLTTPDKWTDSWFSDLSINGKLVFLFLVDNCDNAGFYEINKKFMLFLLGMEEIQLKNALAEIKTSKKCYELSADKKRIWLYNYLKHQKKLPLNPKNNAHKQVIMKLEESIDNQDLFPKCKEIIKLIPLNENKIPTKKAQTRIPRATFTKPTVDELKEFMLEKKCTFEFAKVESEKFWNFYESKNWKVGKEKMSVWKSACSNWIKNNSSSANKSNNQKATKIDNIVSSAESTNDVDYNIIYDGEE